MACSRCGKRNNGNIMEQHKHVNNRQLNARLKVYKKRYCSSCEDIDKCNYKMYANCKKRLK